MNKDCPKGKIYNPKTKRCINDTAANRKKIGVLINLKLVLPNNSSLKANSLLSIKKLIPPMGPLIHPDFIKTHEIDIDEKKSRKQLKKNYIKFYTYIFKDRIPKITNNEVSLSLMEKNDLLNLSDIITKELNEINLLNDEDIKQIKTIENNLKEAFKHGNVINDQPTKKRVGNWYVEPLRYKNRLQLLNLYDLFRSKKAGLEGSIRYNNFRFFVSHQDLDSTLRNKTYIDELIRLGVFTHDDLYKNMFESENVFDELRELHNKYYEAYKKNKKNTNNNS